MKLGDFKIGLEFWCSDKLYRCTDVGSRVIVGIRIDEVTVVTLDQGKTSQRTMTQAEAETSGWFNGPPYGVAEVVFDEDDLEGCSLTRESKQATAIFKSGH